MKSFFFRKEAPTAGGDSSPPATPPEAPTSSTTTSVEPPAFELISGGTLKDLVHAAAQAPLLQDQLLRLRADFENFRKSQYKEKEEAIRYANQSLIANMLPMVDNLELALMAARQAQDAQSILQGLSMVLTQVERFLEDIGVRAVDAKGTAFDPKLHEAVGHHETAEHPEGTVIEQHRKGYLLHDRLLRPASVVVAQPIASEK